MLLGIVLSIIAGMAMSVQGVMNTRLGEGIGNMEANAFVQGTAFALAMIALLFWRQGSFSALGSVSRLYWLGGALGLVSRWESSRCRSAEDVLRIFAVCERYSRFATLSEVVAILIKLRARMR